MRNFPRHRNIRLPEQPEGTFPGGARLRGYTRPKSEQTRRSCVCCEPTQNSDIDANIGKLAEKYGIIAYTIELHFSHCAPLIIRDRASIHSTKYDIMLDHLNTLDESQIQAIEEIQIEYLSGSTYEFTQSEINETRLLVSELKKGGFVVSRGDDYLPNPAMGQMY